MPHQTTTLYITHLDDRVTEKMLKDIFSMISPVQNVKLHAQNHSGLVEFHERRGAEQALHAMDGRIVFGQKIHINWSNQLKKQHDYTILIDGLNQETTSVTLKKLFVSYYPRHVEVLWDSKHKNYYGLMDFEHKQDAEKAMKEMDGYQLSSSSTIQCRWANHQVLDTINTTTNTIAIPSSPLSSTPPSRPATPSFSIVHPSTTCRVTTNNMSYEQIFAQTPPYNTTIRIDNLPSDVSDHDLVPHFQQYGYVSHIERDEHGATIRLDTHANASTAIFALQGFPLDGHALDLSWGTHTFHNDKPIMNSSPIYLAHHHGGFYDMFAMRPPAPVAGSAHSAGGKAGQAIHGWNQYYQNYYSAGHQNI
ncbi:hypothetical protein BC941DRAFT_446256 [Chlamydoabsidia padenii]|nr:hypothetical protein BC941DRAFT_446256 [Chlamydoabsidia padenii]